MQIYTHTLPGGAQLIGYLRDRTVEMPAFNTRPAILILPGGGLRLVQQARGRPRCHAVSAGWLQRLYPLLHLPK